MLKYIQTFICIWTEKQWIDWSIFCVIIHHI